MTVELKNVVIPAEFVELCEAWAGGTDCMLRAIDSTGGLGLGTRRPYNHDVGRSLTDQEWHVSLWYGLASDVRACAKMAEKAGMVDSEALRRFEAFADTTAGQLRTEYGLEDSEAV